VLGYLSVQLVSKISDLCDPDPPTSQTVDGQTDRQTTCDRNTALCTKVHRAVKTNMILSVILFRDFFAENIVI